MDRHAKSSTFATSSGAGRYAWRRRRGLLVISDQVARYRAIRAPRGPYKTPLPDDLIPGWERAA